MIDVILIGLGGFVIAWWAGYLITLPVHGRRPGDRGLRDHRPGPSENIPF